jgi:hypothetical protein
MQLAKSGLIWTIMAGLALAAWPEDGTVHVETPETRIAIVANSTPARSAARMTLAQLSKAPGIVLVEREDVGTLFREIETALLAGGMQRLADRIREYGADLFAVFYADENEPGGSLVVFDAASGVRLADRALPATALDAQAREAYASILQAADKRRRFDAGTLKTVSVTAIRNLDLPAQEDAFVHAAGYLFEQILVNASGFALLERRALEWINRERMQIAPEAAARLESGRLLLEIEVGRTADGNGRKAALRVVDGKGRAVARIESETAKADAPALAADLFARLARELAVKAADAQPERQREADRLFSEFLFLYGHKRYAPALERMEACAALDPARAFPYLAAALLHVGSDMLRGGRIRADRALDYGERAMALWQERHRRNPLLLIPRDGRIVVDGTPEDGYFERAFFRQLLFLDPSEWRPELRRRRMRLLRTYAILIAERGLARSETAHARAHKRPIREWDKLYSEAFSSIPLDNGRELRIAIEWLVYMLGTEKNYTLLSAWIERRPGDFEALFESTAREAARHIERDGGNIFHSELQDVRNALWQTLRDPDTSVTAKQTAKPLLARYNELDLDSPVVPRSIQSDLKFDIASADWGPARRAARREIADAEHIPWQSVVDKALIWLAAQQMENGSWERSTQLTAAALLAFMAVEESAPDGRYWQTVENGLRYLVEQAQLRHGAFLEEYRLKYREQGMASLALTEAYAMTGLPVLRKAAERSIAPLISSKFNVRIGGALHTRQKPYERLTALVSWKSLVMRAGISARLDVADFDRVIARYANNLRLNFDAAHNLFRMDYQHNYSGASETGMGVVGLQAAGYGEADEARAGLRSLGGMKATASEKGFFATQAMLHAGGADWVRWRGELLRLAKEAPYDEGHFPAINNQSEPSFENEPSILTTAYGVLMLAAPRRRLSIYARMPQKDPPPVVLPEPPLPPMKSTVPLLDGHIVFAVHNDSHIYVGRLAENRDLVVSRIAAAPAWQSEEINRIRGPFQTGYLRYGHPLQNARARTALSSENLFVGTHDGVWIVPINGAAPRRLTTDHGLPSNVVQSLAWLDGMLYVALGAEDREMWVVRHDLGRNHTDLLLSSGRLGSDHPVETMSRPPRIRGMAADPERHTLWFLICLHGAQPNLKAEGLWSYRPDQNQWRQAVAHKWDYNVRMHRRNETLLIAGGWYAMCYDLADQKKNRIWIGANDYDNIARLAKAQGVLRRTKTNYISPYAVSDGWLWSSEPFARLHLTTGASQRFAKVPGGSFSVMGLVNEGRHLLAVIGNGLWALEWEQAAAIPSAGKLKKEGETRSRSEERITEQ